MNFYLSLPGRSTRLGSKSKCLGPHGAGLRAPTSFVRPLRRLRVDKLKPVNDFHYSCTRIDSISTLQ